MRQLRSIAVIPEWICFTYKSARHDHAHHCSNFWVISIRPRAIFQRLPGISYHAAHRWEICFAESTNGPLQAMALKQYHMCMLKLPVKLCKLDIVDCLMAQCLGQRHFVCHQIRVSHSPQLTSWGPSTSNMMKNHATSLGGKKRSLTWTLRR